MHWSWKIGRLVGIDVYMHATFLLLVGFIVVAVWLNGHNPARTLFAVLFVMVIFGCIVLHELGHALTARRYGIRTRDIVLLPIGGVARLERMPEEPNQELLVAVAGPAVNVVIALGLFALLAAMGHIPTLRQAATISWTGRDFLPSLLAVNVSTTTEPLRPFLSNSAHLSFNPRVSFESQQRGKRKNCMAERDGSKIVAMWSQSGIRWAHAALLFGVCGAASSQLINLDGWSTSGNFLLLLIFFDPGMPANVTSRGMTAPLPLDLQGGGPGERRDHFHNRRSRVRIGLDVDVQEGEDAHHREED